MLGQHDFSGAVLGGRYHLDRRIGCGAMATIYAATDQTTKGCVAVKVLHPEHDQSADLVRRFTQEGQLAAQIRHPNLVPAHDLGWIGGRHYVVMQLVHGERLPALMQSKPLPWALSVRLVLDLLAGLAALHERGVAHRDVSPYNCMIEPGDDGPRARLLDLGNARVIEETSLVLTQPEASETMSVYGTSRYIAPERLQGGPGDFRADVFSVGALWYTMLTAKTLPDPLPCFRVLDSLPLLAEIHSDWVYRSCLHLPAGRAAPVVARACDRRLAAAGLARPAGAARCLRRRGDERGRPCLHAARERPARRARGYADRRPWGRRRRHRRRARHRACRRAPRQAPRQAAAALQTAGRAGQVQDASDRTSED